jgi:hypothetical protein
MHIFVAHMPPREKVIIFASKVIIFASIVIIFASIVIITDVAVKVFARYRSPHHICSKSRFLQLVGPGQEKWTFLFLSFFSDLPSLITHFL